MPTEIPKLAVLIDADNASPAISSDLFREIAKIGDACVRRLYGDFSSGRMSGWIKAMPEFAILPEMNLANTTGKNASDIALVIDAMDLLHAGWLDGFCLVSSDSDFTRLAARIREQGVAVYGFGEQKTPDSFVMACQRFIYTENLSVAVEEATKEEPAKREVTDKRTGLPPSKATPLIRKAIDALDEDGEGWVALSTVGQKVNNLTPDFDSRSYGCAKLSDLAKKTGVFELKNHEGRMMIRFRGGGR